MKSLGIGGDRSLSLKSRLGLGAAILGSGTLLTAAILYFGMVRVGERLDAALASEARMAQYATLSTQVSTLIVIATEAVQSGQPTGVRVDRIAPVSAEVRNSLNRLGTAIEQAVEAVRAEGIDEQSRFATQSLELARMRALLDDMVAGYGADTQDRVRLRAQIAGFAQGFDPVLHRAVSTEVLFRSDIFSRIERLRQGLGLVAGVIAGLTLLLVAGLYFGLIRPQFRRLDRLRTVAHRIGQEDFEIALPEGVDEIGMLHAETNRMAAALAARREAVKAEWNRLNEVIAERTADLRNANARLEAIDEARRRLFADISHELRTPLTVIRMEAQLGQKDASDPIPAFRTIEARAQRLNRRIDDLLRVARSDTGQLGLDMTTARLPQIAAEVVDEVGGEFDNAGMTLDVAEVPDIAVHCDPNWLRQVLVSLLRNTIRHARAGERARLAGDTGGATAGIGVIDNGPGIAEADLGRIFERFQQGGPGNNQGFGVGLALARWVTEAQQGEVALVSPVPRDEALGRAPGTKIVVRLRRADH